MCLNTWDRLVVEGGPTSPGAMACWWGPHSTAAERAAFAEKITAEPRNYMAQPTISLSRVPTIVGDRIEGRHVDLRPYVIFGEEIYVQPGGLTRVALNRGSLVGQFLPGRRQQGYVGCCNEKSGEMM